MALRDNVGTFENRQKTPLNTPHMPWKLACALRKHDALLVGEEVLRIASHGSHGWVYALPILLHDGVHLPYISVEEAPFACSSWTGATCCRSMKPKSPGTASEVDFWPC